MTFQSTPSWRGRQNNKNSWAFWPNFNPRPREEGDQGAFDFPSKKKDFNPRPREEGDQTLPDPEQIKIDFNPRPREEGDKPLKEVTQAEIISIHALVKRATTIILMTMTEIIPFQSTPSWRGRHRYCDWHRNRGDFNPRPREEGDAI